MLYRHREFPKRKTDEYRRLKLIHSTHFSKVRRTKPHSPNAIHLDTRLSTSSFPTSRSGAAKRMLHCCIRTKLSASRTGVQHIHHHHRVVFGVHHHQVNNIKIQQNVINLIIEKYIDYYTLTTYLYLYSATSLMFLCISVLCIFFRTSFK